MNRLRLIQAQEASPQLPSSSSSAPPPPSFSSLSSSSSSSCSSSSMYTHYTNQSNLPNTTLYRQDNQNFPKSWSQLLLDGLVEEKEEEEEDDDDDRMISSSFAPHFQPKLVENWKDQVLYPPPNTNIVGPKQESYGSGYMYQNKTEDIQITMRAPFWSHALHASSINSCATTSLSSSSSSMLDISKNKPDSNNLPVENSSDHQCNSTTGSALKKARVQISSVSLPTIKVRKEKLGDRITALHQLVSPYGKTDTASVLQEAIGYIRFLHHQIEALCLPYLVDGSTNSRQLKKDERSDVSHEVHFQDQDACEEPKKDLRSKGLCLVPISLILHVERDNKANYWA